MEPLIVIVASLIGVVVSALLLVDAYHDRWLVLQPDNYDPELGELVINRIINEWMRWLLQSIMLSIAVLFGTNIERFREIAGWLMFSLPIVLTGWSLYLYIRRQRILRMLLEEKNIS